jgi:hypothetical protein
MPLRLGLSKGEVNKEWAGIHKDAKKVAKHPSVQKVKRVKKGRWDTLEQRMWDVGTGKGD